MFTNTHYSDLLTPVAVAVEDEFVIKLANVTEYLSVDDIFGYMPE